MQTATQQQGAGAGVGTPVLANSLIPGDRIVVTLTATKPSKERISIHEVFDYQGNRVDNAGQAIGGRALSIPAAGSTQPEFPTASYTAALRAENEAEAGRILKDWRNQLAQFGGAGGTTLGQRIGSAVYAYLQAEHNVGPGDGEHLVLRKEQVVAKTPLRANADEPGVFLVQLAPTWGQRH